MLESSAGDSAGRVQIVKTTGMCRPVDRLGRVVLPAELRRTLGIPVGAGLEFFSNGKQIIVKPHEPGCVFCGEADEVVEFKGHRVCRQCVAAMPRPSEPAGM